MRSTIRAFRVLLTALVILLVSPMAASFAHADLTTTNPIDGSELAAAPMFVELNFSESLLPDTVEIAVTTEGFGLISGTTFSTNGGTVTVPWDQSLPGGEYQVAYRVVSNDGHPVTGTITFSYPGETGLIESETVDVEPINSESDDESSGISVIWLIVIGLLVGAGIGYVIRRRS